MEHIGRSLSMNMSNKPGAIPRPSPPRISPTNKNPNPNNNKNMHIKTGQRLRAATSFSPQHPPSSMAIRRTGIGGSGCSSEKSLAAIAGPMGITIVDVLAPQRPWLVLNYSSSSESASSSRKNGSGGISGGITTMAFQPCPSILPQSLSDTDGGGPASPNHGGGGDGYKYYQSSSPILLATARGSGILIWDCSGRALSPLLGRLNASDSWGTGAAGTNKTSSVGQNGGSKRNNVDDNSMGSEESGGTKQQTQPTSSSAGVESNAASTTLDTVKSLVSSPLSLERKSSLISVSSSSSVVTSSNTTNLLLGNTSNNNSNSNPSGAGLSSAAKTSSAGSSSFRGNAVTSLDWKGSNPILLSTCANSACIWDLRTSLLNSAGCSSNSSGARPNARFVSPEDGLHHSGSSLIHCAYSHGDELQQHSFATLDSMGVVRIWDDRRADRPKHSFMACPGGGVGIASIAPAKTRVDASRWVTWGMDGGQESFSDDLVVKVWTESSSTSKSRSNVTSTVPTDADVGDRNEECGETNIPYHVTSRISMAGGVAARVHPLFADGILLFRDNPSEREDGPQQITTTGPSNPTGFGVSAGEMTEEGTVEGLVESPDKMILVTGLKMRTTPEMAVVQTPPSSPPLMLKEPARDQEPDESSISHVHKGWEAELWCIDTVDTPLPSVEAREINEENRSLGAQKIIAFRGGGVEEDALSFAPGRGDVSGVLAVDLALGAPVDSNGNASLRNEELSLCVLTKASRLTAYGVPEASELAEEKATEIASNKRGRVDAESNMTHSVSSRVYRQSTDHYASPWWNKNEEEELFGESNTARESPKKSSMESLRTVVDNADIDLTSNSAVRGVPRMPENITEKASIPSIIPDVDLAASMDEVVENREVDTSAAQNLPIDPATVPVNVPCPPLCGVAFSGVGGLVMFNNGPVKRMWAHYQSNEVRVREPKKGSDVISIATSDEEDSTTHNQDLADQRMQSSEKTLPRTLADLIEMNLRSQNLQWGGDNEQPGDDSSSSSGGSSSYEDGELLGLESDESGGISDSDDSEGFYHVASSDSPRRHSLDFSTTEHEGANEAFAGLPSLSPSVVITRKHDDILLNGQTPKLANILKLGEQWFLTKDFSVPDAGCGKRAVITGLEGPKDMEFPRNSSDPYLSSSPFADRTLARSSSFSPPPSKSSKHTSMMGNLKKLFANQLPTAMAPPDQRLMNSKNVQKSTKILQSKERPGSTSLEGSNKPHLGVYTLENPQTPDAASERLVISRKLCLYNAKVCSDCGQDSKADTWTLLAQTIQSIFIFEMDETDGWGGDGDALTNGIVEQILHYYEVQGDFQMLSTIVCVLTFGRDRRSSSSDGGRRYQLLPKFDDRRYDNYIHIYAALLYGWGVLTVRSEISKRLAYSTPGAGAETLIQLNKNISGDSTLLPNSGVAPGVSFTPLCGSCGEPVTDANNVCHKCKEYAFQCSICCSAVRGACTWCPLCGHGGHAGHMRQWFQRQTVCPTGCGCICMLGNTPAHPRTTY